MNKICVLGSLNMDMVLKVKNMAKEGETIFAKSLKTIAGGKGANQAVAAKRMGCEVYILGKIGQDNNGKFLYSQMIKEDICVDYLLEDNIEPTGMALINVNDAGNNSIVVLPGANMAITSKEIENSYSLIETCEAIIAQFETPIETTIQAFEYARAHGVITILNPAPAKAVEERLLKTVDLIIPNETEAYELTGIEVKDLETAKEAAKKFIEKGVKYVIITLGSKGAALIGEKRAEIIPAYKVKAVDTTAAGDSFIGALSSKLSKNEFTFETLKEAIYFGNKVSSIVVQREGAQPSIPTVEEVMTLYKEV